MSMRPQVFAVFFKKFSFSEPEILTEIQFNRAKELLGNGKSIAPPTFWAFISSIKSNLLIVTGLIVSASVLWHFYGADIDSLDMSQTRVLIIGAYLAVGLFQFVAILLTSISYIFYREDSDYYYTTAKQEIESVTTYHEYLTKYHPNHMP